MPESTLSQSGTNNLASGLRLFFFFLVWWPCPYATLFVFIYLYALDTLTHHSFILRWGPSPSYHYLSRQKIRSAYGICDSKEIPLVAIARSLLSSVADPSRNPDPPYFHPGSEPSPSRIPAPHKRIKYFNPKKNKKWFLSSRKYDLSCSSRIRMLTFYLSRIQGSKRHRIPNPQHCFYVISVGRTDSLCKNQWREFWTNVLVS
jgi:hypothetical protein